MEHNTLTVGQLARLLLEAGDKYQGLRIAVRVEGHELPFCCPTITAEGNELTINVELPAWLAEIPDAPGERYLCHWGAGYGECKDVPCTFDWFTVEKGYMTEAREAIAKLAVGETADLSDMSGVHTVRRTA